MTTVPAVLMSSAALAFCSQVCSFKVGAGLLIPRRRGEAKMPAAPSAARRAPRAVARLSEVKHTVQVVTSEVMDPLGTTVYEQCMPFFMQMCWHSKQVATIKITRSQERGGGERVGAPETQHRRFCLSLPDASMCHL